MGIILLNFRVSVARHALGSSSSLCRPILVLLRCCIFVLFVVTLEVEHEILLAVLNLLVCGQQHDEKKRSAAANDRDDLKFPKVVHILARNMNEVVIDGAANVAANTILYVVKACKHGKAGGLNVLGSNFCEQNAHWQHDKAHGEDVANDVGEDDDEAVRDAERQVDPGHEHDSEWCAEQADHDLCDGESADLKVFKPAAEDVRTDEHAGVVKHGDHRVLELSDADDVEHEVVIECAEVWKQSVECHPDDD